ncbi:MAG: T9SS type A sorting domain-containing protein [Bacteroidales bacterium]|nr:T9SS type A sorting domain-containing protein [Bacteroidales bacterium]
MKSILLLFVFTFLIISTKLFGEGTKEVMPNTSNGTALHIGPQWQTGPYRGAPTDNRVYFTIKDYTTERFYFGLNGRMRTPSSGTVSDDYFRIVSESGSQVVAPTQVPNSGPGFISTHTEAVNGPDIGSYTAGYTPIVFTPTANGTYYIELYRSTNGGSSAVTTSSGEVYYIYFDFTVATTSNQRFDGRVYSRNWSFITYNPVSPYTPSINYSFQGSVYGYTTDSMVNKVDFASGFRPLGFNIQMNYEGVNNTGDFAEDRKSEYVGAITASIVNPYQVFLNQPDTSVFKVSGVTSQPIITGNIYGCEGDYYIPYYISRPGDVAILLDINGSPGYQTGTTDRVLEAYNVAEGNHVMSWDGNDGLGNPVTGGLSLNITADIYRGRTNVPLNDAEVNTGGFSITSIFPQTGNRIIYWDDTDLPNDNCYDQNEDNSTGPGIAVTNYYEGVLGPAHAWNGPYGTSSGGTNTPSDLCDDFGNARVINTWFYAENVSSTPVAKTVPSCSTGGGLTYQSDLDDDDDGISDLIESGGVDPNADADSDGIPNYIDPSYAGFRDVNYDGVNDNFDADLDGLINSIDLDADNDGLYDILEALGTDGNNNGLVDNFVDENENGIHDPYDIECTGGTITNYGSSIIGYGGQGIVNQNNILGAPDGNVAQVTYNQDFIIVDLGQELASGSTITFRWREKSGQSGTAMINVYADLNSNPTTIQTCPSTDNTSLVNSNVVLNTAARYVKISKGYNTCNSTSSTDYEVDAISFNYTVPCSGGVAMENPDTDDNGISNAYDIDSDDDGISDLVEAGGVDINGDGRIDNQSDANQNGILDIYDSNCDGTSAIYSGYANSVYGTSGTVYDPSYAIDGSYSSYCRITDGAYINVDFGNIIPSGTTITAYLATNNTNGINSTMTIWSSEDGNSFTQLGGAYTTNTQPTNGNAVTRTLTSDARYIRISRAGYTNANGRFHRVDYEYTISSPCSGGDLIANLDTDGDGIKNYLDLDSDNDGIPDVVEAGGTDANNDGKIDGYDDRDNDGFSDNVDGDANNDGTIENTANVLIITGTDADSDGIPDSYPRANVDAVGLPNSYDLDADNDGIVDVREAGLTDSDNNGIADGTLGSDGWSNTVDVLSSLNLLNTDGFGLSNFLDIDSDNDGIPDNIEAQETYSYISPSGLDSDGDGIDNAFDNNDGLFGGNANNGIEPWDTDMDGLPDYYDEDSDDDNFNDRNEGWDLNGDGYVRAEDGETVFVGTTDSDGDGLLDEYDVDDSNPNPTNGYNPLGYPDERQPGGADMDWREQDDEGTVLPVELYSQSLELIDQTALVSWTTLSEINNRQFLIQKSMNNKDFETFGIVAGAGNSNVPLNYSLIDPNPAFGISYYRILQEDFDGKTETFPVMVLNNNQESQISIYPNPTSDIITIEAEIGCKGEIYNQNSQLITRFEMSEMNKTISLRDYGVGTYMIKIIYSDKIISQIIIVR